MNNRLKLIDGVYELQEWRRGGKSFRHPAAAGRVVYGSGTVTLVMRCDGGSWESHRYGLGSGLRFTADGLEVHADGGAARLWKRLRT